MNNRYQIQRCDINGDWDNIFRADFKELNEAKKFAKEWAKYDPKCAWGVQVVDTMDDSVVYEP